MVTFWDEHNFALDDPVNLDIWAHSPSAQRRIQPPSELLQPGSIGAQQAMLESGFIDGVTGSDVLPWVPDLVGKDWLDPSSLIIVGSAYGPVIQEFSGMRESMPLKTYVTAPSSSEFVERYLRAIAQRHFYYGRIAELARASDVGDGSGVAVFDLCRASFVRRGSAARPRGDKGGDNVVKLGRKHFYEYVHAGEGWAGQRLSQGAAARIVALGSIAEHGLLQVFNSLGTSIRTRSISGQNGSPWIPRTKDWAIAYADDRYQVRSWVATDSFWEISGTVESEERRWFLLPVRHPSDYGGQSQYSAAGDLLKKIASLADM